MGVPFVRKKGIGMLQFDVPCVCILVYKEPSVVVEDRCGILSHTFLNWYGSQSPFNGKIDCFVDAKLTIDVGSWGRNHHPLPIQLKDIWVGVLSKLGFNNDLIVSVLESVFAEGVTDKDVSTN